MATSFFCSSCGLGIKFPAEERGPISPPALSGLGLLSVVVLRGLAVSASVLLGLGLGLQQVLAFTSDFHKRTFGFLGKRTKKRTICSELAPSCLFCGSTAHCSTSVNRHNAPM